MKKYTTVFLAVILLLNIAACSAKKAENLSANVSIETNEELEQSYQETKLAGLENKAITDFGLNTLRNCYAENTALAKTDKTKKNANALISPLSITECLAMVENGAKDNTLKEMEVSTGLDLNSANKYFKDFNYLLSTEQTPKLFVANSIWLRDDEFLKVEDDFLQKNAFFYHAEIYKRSFDNGLKDDINTWASKNTNQMIDKVIDKITNDSVMFLVNAISFIADWQNEYESNDVFDSTFTLEDGTEQEIELMYSEEYQYLENKNAKGIIKPYKDNKYAFVALLPNEKLSMKEYLDKLSAEEIHTMIKNAKSEDVETYIPKFKSEYEITLNDTLKKMGIEDAFDADKADFTKLGKSERGNIYISKVLHKTFIEVDEKGTKAAAVTVVDMADGAAMDMAEPIIVRLDRPFVYMIYDVKNDLPIFMGYILKIK